jgi:hypothetical protein
MASLRRALLVGCALGTAAVAAVPAHAATLTFDEECTSFVSSPDGSLGWMTTYPYGGEADARCPATTSGSIIPTAPWALSRSPASWAG